jgi:hypothetical protein
MFLVYFLVTVAAFVTRPAHTKAGSVAGGSGNKTGNATSLFNVSYLLDPSVNLNDSLNSLLNLNLTALLLSENSNFTEDFDGDAELFSEPKINASIPEIKIDADSSLTENGGNDTEKSGTFFLTSLSSCFKEPKSWVDSFRLGMEGLMLLGSISFLLGALRECQFLGASMFFENLVGKNVGKFELNKSYGMVYLGYRAISSSFSTFLSSRHSHGCVEGTLLSRIGRYCRTLYHDDYCAIFSILLSRVSKR